MGISYSDLLKNVDTRSLKSEHRAALDYSVDYAKYDTVTRLTRTRQNEYKIKMQHCRNYLMQCAVAYLEQGNYHNALFCLEKLAENKDAAAEYYIGMCYAAGLGGVANIGLAVKYYLRAAEKGHAEAQYELAKYYEAEAAKWYQKAAEQGHEKAKQVLAKPQETTAEEKKAVKGISAGSPVPEVPKKTEKKPKVYLSEVYNFDTYRTALQKRFDGMTGITDQQVDDFIAEHKLGGFKITRSDVKKDIRAYSTGKLLTVSSKVPVKKQTSVNSSEIKDFNSYLSALKKHFSGRLEVSSREVDDFIKINKLYGRFGITASDVKKDLLQSMNIRVVD